MAPLGARIERAMPQPARGTVSYRPGRDGHPGTWWGRITCHDGSRPWLELGDWPNSKQGRARAKETAAHLTERFASEGIVGTPPARALAEGASGNDVIMV